MDISKIKNIAKALLSLDIQLDEDFDFLIHHPFFNNRFMCIDNELIDITANPDKCRTYMSSLIDKANNLERLFIYINKAYHLLFFKLINEYLDEKEFGEYLAYVWVSSENPNQDINVSLKEIKKWFKRANKLYLMNEEDYNYYKTLPNKIKIYRGVANGRNPKGISYTDNKETAEWFMNRFGKNGYLIEKEIDKKDIAAYFNTRGEKVIVYIG